MAEEGAARALPSRPREQPLDPNKPAKEHQGGARGPSPGTRKGGGPGVRSRRSYSSEGGGGGYGAGSGEIGRLTCSSRCSRYRPLRGQHGASASSRSSRGAKRARLGRERTRPWRRETGVAWALTETREKEGRAKPRESENSEGWQGSTEAQRAPSALGRESARGKIPPPPDAYARALESDTQPGIPGAVHWEQWSLGNCSPSLSGYPPAVAVWRTHPGRGGSGREGAELSRLFDDWTTTPSRPCGENRASPWSRPALRLEPRPRSEASVDPASDPYRPRLRGFRCLTLAGAIGRRLSTLRTEGRPQPRVTWASLVF